MNEETEHLIEQWLERSLDDDKQEKLAARLKEDPAGMQQFVEMNVREQMLRHIAKGVLVADVVHAVAPVPSKTLRRSSLWIVTVGAGLAICLSTIGWFINREPNLQPVILFVSVAAVQDVDGPFDVGDRLGAELIEINSGLIRLLFDDGVEVTLQGPARYELNALGRTRLHAGLLTATVPPGAEGFLVDTPTAEVVDLGTVFGVQLVDDGVARVSVFDGEVEVTPTDGNTKSLVQEGETVHIGDDREVESSAFDTVSFEKIWPVASGIAGSSGAFRFAPPWPRRMGMVQSDSEIFVLPEGYPQTLDEPLRLNATSAGSFRVAADLTDSELPALSRVKSFLLQFKPIDRRPGNAGSPSNRTDAHELKRIVGDITFDQPVLGLIIRGADLRSSDGRFSVRGGQIPQKGRALELFGTPRDDMITLSEDLRTVQLDLAAFGVFSDQVRVIVAQPLAK